MTDDKGMTRAEIDELIDVFAQECGDAHRTNDTIHRIHIEKGAKETKAAILAVFDALTKENERLRKIEGAVREWRASEDEYITTYPYMSPPYKDACTRAAVAKVGLIAALEPAGDRCSACGRQTRIPKGHVGISPFESKNGCPVCCPESVEPAPDDTEEDK
jgi:hypothetical protein